MNESQKVSLGLQLAGVNQYKVFSAVMENFSTATEAYAKAMSEDTIGSALRENEKYMDSIEAKANNLKAIWTEITVGDGSMQQLVKDMLDLASTALKVIDALGGLKTILIGLSTILIASKTSSILSGIQKLSTAFKNLPMTIGKSITYFKELKSVASEGVVHLSDELDLLVDNTKAVEQAQLQLSSAMASVLVVSLSLAITAIDAYKRKQSELKQEAINAYSELQSEQETTKQLIAEINNESTAKSRLLEINKQLGGSATESIQDEIDLRKQNLKLIYDERQAELDKYLTENKYAYQKAEERLHRTDKAGLSEQAIVSNVGETIENADSVSWFLNSYYQNMKEQTEEDASTVDAYTSALRERNTTYEQWLKIYGDYEETIEDSIDEEEALAQAIAEIEAIYGDVLDENGELKVSLEDLNDEWTKIANKLSEVNSGYNALKSAVDDYNDTGSFSLETLQKLLTLDSQYLDALVIEEGQLRINKDVLLENVKVQAEQIKQELIQNTLDQLSAIAIGEKFNATEDYTKSIEDNTLALDENTEAKINNLLADINTEKGKEQAQQVIANMKTRMDLIQKFVDSYDFGDRTASKAITNSSNKATEAIEKQVDALKKAKETELDLIEDQIDALKKERDARKEYWESVLKQLENANKEKERSIELEEKLQALELAKQTKVKVLKDGTFQYVQDETAVDSAQYDYDKTKEEQDYERYKESLEAQRDLELANYDERIEALEDYKDQVSDKFDEEIELLNTRKESIKENLNSSLSDQKEYFANSEKEYEKYLNNLEAITKKHETHKDKVIAKNYSMYEPLVVAKPYASGSDSIGSNQLALVGDNPNYRELVIGSSLNNDQGTLLSLHKGDGIVNSNATKTLAGIFNALSDTKFNASKFDSSNGQVINIGTIELPQVKDGNDFINCLQNFKADLNQIAYAR